MLKRLARSLPGDFSITLCDVGSAGGLHKRWRPVRPFVSAILFDPLDQSTGSSKDRYFPVALDAEPGEGILHVTQRISMTSMLAPNSEAISRFWFKPAHTEIVRDIPVPLNTLDNLVVANDLRIDAIKIDTQGAEFRICSGARKCLANQVMLAELEVSFFDRYTGLRPFEDMIAFMRECGFELIDISRLKRYYFSNRSGVIKPGLGGGDRPGRIAFCDAIFVRRIDTLVDHLRDRYADGEVHAPLKAITLMIVYGKADIAAWLFDEFSETISPEIAEALRGEFKRYAGKRRGPAGLHLALDYFSRRV